jgi:hypothetical protein
LGDLAGAATALADATGAGGASDAAGVGALSEAATAEAATAEPTLAVGVAAASAAGGGELAREQLPRAVARLAASSQLTHFDPFARCSAIATRP